MKRIRLPFTACDIKNLGVNDELLITGLPVAINISCHALRSAEETI